MNPKDFLEPDDFLTAEQKAAYLGSGCSRCPHCQSKAIEATGLSAVDGNYNKKEIVCQDCGASWYEVVTICGILGTSNPDSQIA